MYLPFTRDEKCTTKNCGTKICGQKIFNKIRRTKIGPNTAYTYVHGLPICKNLGITYYLMVLPYPSLTWYGTSVMLCYVIIVRYVRYVK